jgi:L-ribulose-5-phosphate 3-epimerase
MSLRYGYVSNGLADHRLDDAIDLLAACGYDGLSLTLDHHHLDPFDPDLPSRVRRLRRRLGDAGLACTIETGGRFVLDGRAKHHPSLLSEGRERRIDLLVRAVRIAADLGAPGVSSWSGVLPAGASREVGWERLVEGVAAVLAVAEDHGVTLGFEPEPGMLVETIDQWHDLAADLGHRASFGLTLDLGHCLCVEADDVGACVRRAGPRLVHVHVEDMRRGVHEHLDFGEGDLDLGAALGALGDIGFGGLVSVELSRHSHAAHLTVPRSIEVLRAATRPRTAPSGNGSEVRES